MNVAIFTDTFSPDINGVAKTLKRLTEYLQANNHQYRVFAPKHFRQQMDSENINQLSSLPFILYPECRFSIPNLLQISAELKEFKPDIIHVATPFNIGLCGIHYANKFNIPLVGSYHTDFDQYLSYYNLPFLSKTLWRYMKWFHRSMEKIFVPSKDTLEKLKSKGFQNLSIWSRGVDTSIFNPNYSTLAIREKYHIKEKYILSYVGRLAPEKDIFKLQEIMHSLPKELSEQVRWLIVGDGPSKQELIDNAPKNATFTGYLHKESLAEVYTASDLFVFPSSTETFGNVVLEALACGTPALCANAGGVRNIIKDSETGVLCKSGTIEEYVQHITHLLHQEQKRNAMSRAGVKYASLNGWDSHLKKLIQEYHEITSNRLLKKHA
ncbi:glycosyltransferase family 4 protein [Aquibacillus kalidii]|uniref:glycosyltransferase family 4 protein n=1 Tax=Aquibacillus kalidii TaxID=2762597 RepID=UPI0016459801|nr:glycosyltransferase family 1 protein [Aquibacillus kalidii]